MDFDFPSTDAATLPHDGNDVLLIQQNHAYWQPIIGLQLPIVAVATLFVRFTFWMKKKRSQREMDQHSITAEHLDAVVHLSGYTSSSTR